MKKLSAILLALVIASSVALTSCTSPKPNATTSAAETGAAVSTAAPDTAAGMTLEDIIEQQSAQLDSMKESFKDLMDIEISAKGNSILYTYTYKIDIPDKKAVKEQLKTQASSMKASLSSVFTLFETAGISDASMIFEFKAKDGEVLYKEEFKK